MAKTKSRKTSSSRIEPEDRATAYAQAVLAGEIVAGPHVRNACRRHIDDLKRTDIHFDGEAASRAYRFFETKLKLSEGQFENTPFLLHPAQAFKIGSIFGWKRADGTRRFRRAYIEEGKGNGKALALDTPIPTPAGWTTMGELRDGDLLFDDRGNICRVVQAHPVSVDRDCFRVKFDDGAEIVASAEHLWLTEKRTATKAGEHRATRGVPKAQWGGWKQGLRTTAEIADTLRYANGKYQSANHSVSLCGALATADIDLPIEPYGLGVWLGDGDSDCARITIGDQDAEATVSALRTAGWEVSERRGSKRYRVSGMQSKLRAEGLLRNKHIPAAYLRASEPQRWAILQGLMDTDGYVSASGQCEFTQVTRHLSEQVLELLLSLGFKATMATGVAKLDGRTIGPKYRVTFYPREDHQCFRLVRKQEKLVSRHSRRRLSADRKIVACEKVERVPVRCITVDSPSEMFLAGRSMVPTHNSPFAGGIGLYGLMADSEAGAEIYSAGATKEQASILFRDAVKMVDKSPDISARIKPSGGPGREFNLAYLRTGSFFRPVSREAKKTGSGPRPHFALVDELHEHADGGIIEILERGFKFRRQPLLLMITNSGSDRNSICWKEHEFAVKVAAGNADAKDDDAHYLGENLGQSADSTFSYICALDKGDDPLEDPSCWIKANPLLGITITEEYLAGVVSQAKGMPTKLNGVLRLHFCQWTDAQTAWMTRAMLEPAIADFEPLAAHAGKELWLGLDLSQNRDITALAAVVKTGEIEVEAERDGKIQKVWKPTFDAWVEAWTPGDTLDARAQRDGLEYRIWSDQGFLHAPKGASIRYDHVAQAVAEYDHDFDVQCVAYDRFAFRTGFEPECEKLGLSVEFIEHPQGGTKKGKPSEAMKLAAEASGEIIEGLWMPGSLRELEDAILERRIRIKRNPVLISAMMSASTDEDRWGNYWLAKERSVKKIDCAVALCMALGAAMMKAGNRPVIDIAAMVA